MKKPDLNPPFFINRMANKTNSTMPRVLILLLTAFALVLMVTPSLQAQEAPPFSNDLMMDDKTHVFFMTDRLEYYRAGAIDPIVWDAQGWVGIDLSKFWFKAEGEASTLENEGEMEFKGLYSRAISPYFDVQAGIRYDLGYSREGRESRTFGVLALQGLAPYLFEVDGSLFVSFSGDISAVVEGEYDLPLTQRLIGQPRFATAVALQEVPKHGVGSGFNRVELGFRLRYEIKREFAPYVGISWKRKLGETADFARLEGEKASMFGLVGGVRMWF